MSAHMVKATNGWPHELKETPLYSESCDFTAHTHRTVPHQNFEATYLMNSICYFGHLRYILKELVPLFTNTPRKSNMINRIYKIQGFKVLVRYGAVWVRRKVARFTVRQLNIIFVN